MAVFGWNVDDSLSFSLSPFLLFALPTTTYPSMTRNGSGGRRCHQQGASSSRATTMLHFTCEQF